MAAPTTQYPPPLSSPPTVESLEQLLEGLQRPLRRGAEAPAVTAFVGDVTLDGPLFDEHPSRLHTVALDDDGAGEPATFSAAVVPTADAARVEPVAAPPTEPTQPTEPAVEPARAPTPAPTPTPTSSGLEGLPGGLSWSAHPRGAGRRRRRVLLAVATAATTLGAAAVLVDQVL